MAGPLKSEPPPSIPSDSQLVERIVLGDRSCLGILFERYRHLAFRVAYRLLGNEPDALDAVQDGFVNALRHAHQFRSQCSFKTWLLRVVSNAAIDLGRQRRRHDSRFTTGSSFDSDGVIDLSAQMPGIQLDGHELRQQLERALEVLSVAQRQTFVLHVDGGLSYQEIADVLGVSIGTVMSRLFYARQRLRSLLADQVLR